jgi:pre-mRNA-splicing factor 38B
MQVTWNQMRALINHTDSPYIRCLGFLHLRYTAPPGELFDWYETYLDDPEVFTPTADKTTEM